MSTPDPRLQYPPGRPAQAVRQLLDALHQLVDGLRAGHQWVSYAEWGLITTVDTDAKTATLHTATWEGAVTYGRTPPAVGDWQIGYFPNTGTPWIKTAAPNRFWLYWIALPPTQDATTVGTLMRTAWPLAAVPVLEPVATFPYPQGLSRADDVTGLTLLGVDGQGTVYVAAQRNGPSNTLSRTGYGTGPLITHMLPFGTDPVGGTTGTGSWTVKALATRPGAPGVLIATRATISLAVDLGEAFPYTSDFTYLRSDDKGETWAPLFSLLAGEVTFEDTGGVLLAVHVFSYHGPAGAAFAWLAADRTEATGLGVGVGDLAYVIGGENQRGIDANVAVHPFLVDEELLAAGTPYVYATANDDQFPNGPLLGAGIRPDGTWAVYRYNVGATPPFGYRVSADGPAGPWGVPAGTPGAGAYLRAFAQDRTFTHALWLDNETAGVLTTDGGATWTGLTVGQGALLASVLTTDPNPGFWGGGVIIAAG